MAVSLLRPLTINSGNNKNNTTRPRSPTSSPSLTTPTTEYPPRRRLAPGLSQRLRHFEDQQQLQKTQAENRAQNNIGRIPGEQINHIEGLHRQHLIEVRRRGRAWSGPQAPTMPIPGGVRLDGRALLSEPENDSSVMSDVSSVISISSHMVGSDTDDGEGKDPLDDNKKYRMPDIGKTRLNLRTKEPLSPSPRPHTAHTVAGASPPTPTTPRTQWTTNQESPVKYESPRFSQANSTENASDSEVTSSGLSRSGSIYTISRVSFTGQLSQLTSIRLPDAGTLAKRVKSIPTAHEAAKTLADASEQIHLWIAKASEVLGGLSAEDDVEWAAAGGREGIQEVDNAVNRLECLVDAYVLSIDQLQSRRDINDLPAKELAVGVKQMDVIIKDWQRVKETLRSVKDQVEIAMEWEQLWNTFLGGIGQELDELSRLIFEMEEKRHQGAHSLFGSKETIDLAELETIVEDLTEDGDQSTDSNRFSIAPFSLTAQIRQASSAKQDKTDSGLLGLFARMQPMRASLDFLPMRLYSFHVRGNTIFPTACSDLEQRRDQLETTWKKLEADAESLRRELGEDKWITVFRNAGKQALKMCESITRSYQKLKNSIDAGEQHTNIAVYAKKTENYTAKKQHYGPAIQRVLAIIDRGVQDRLTVNGEILRLQSEMKIRWTHLQAEMRDMDLLLEDVENDLKDKQLRDSISTVMSSERSPASSFVGTPGSSPASSIVGVSRENSFQGSRTPTPLTYQKTRQSGQTHPIVPRISLLPSGSSIPRRVPVPGNPGSDRFSSPRSSPSTPTTVRSASTPAVKLVHPEPIVNNRPRWISVIKTDIQRFPPLSASEPSPYAKTPLTPKTNYLRSSVHLRSTPSSVPLLHSTTGRNFSAPAPPASFAKSTASSHRRKSSIPIPATSTPAKQPLPSRPLLSKGSVPILRTVSRMATGNRRSSMLSPYTTTVDGNEADSESPSHHRRPASSLASGRRSSMLVGSCESPRSETRLATSRTTSRSQEGKPRWRP